MIADDRRIIYISEFIPRIGNHENAGHQCYLGPYRRARTPRIVRTTATIIAVQTETDKKIKGAVFSLPGGLGRLAGSITDIAESPGVRRTSISRSNPIDSRSSSYAILSSSDTRADNSVLGWDMARAASQSTNLNPQPFSIRAR